MRKKVLGGVTLFTAGAFFAREFLVWAYGKALEGLFTSTGSFYSFLTDSWQNAFGIALMLVGLTLTFFPRRQSPDVSLDPSIHMHASAVAIIERVRAHRSSPWFRQQNLEPIEDIARAGLAVLVSFQKTGFAVPRFDCPYFEQVAIGLERYFSVLLPLMSQGHLEEAKLASTPAAEQATEVANHFKPQLWFKEALNER